MAVTQQLARVSAVELAACRRSVGELDRLCSFKARPPADHLDLDWAPAELLRVAAKELDPAAYQALSRAVGGDFEVNPGYRGDPHGVWEHPVSGLEPDAVAVIATALNGIDAIRLLANPARGSDAPGAGYLAQHFAALRRFFDEAAAAGLAVVTWWD